MDEIFPQYFQPTAAAFESMLETGTVIPDTNVLLNLYRWSRATSEEFLEILEGFGDRVWVPNRVAEEFLTRRHEIAAAQHRAYEDVLKQLAEVKKGIAALRVHRYHPHLNGDELRQPLARALASVERRVKRARAAHEPLPDDEGDALLRRLNKAVRGRVGAAPSEEEIRSWRADAEARFKAKIPPGYLDAEKEGDDRFGDYLIWRETLAHAMATKRPLIFVTDDEKEDWWRRTSGRTWGPRPELIAELREAAGVPMWMYTSVGFISVATTFLGRKRNERAEAEALAAREATRERAIAVALAAQRAARESEAALHAVAAMEAASVRAREALERARGTLDCDPALADAVDRAEQARRVAAAAFAQADSSRIAATAQAAAAQWTLPPDHHEEVMATLRALERAAAFSPRGGREAERVAEILSWRRDDD